jgi:DNA-directed RNA polymerase subunit RPC12/RpoP
MDDNAHRLAFRIATLYDSGFGTVDYTCDKCGQKVKSRALPPGWSDEGGNRHRCPGCQNGPT